MFDMDRIGKKISDYRRNCNMTQMELADRLSISYQAVSNWERGQTMPDVSKLPELADIFGISIDELLDRQPGAEYLEKLTRHNNDEQGFQGVDIIHHMDLQSLENLAPILKPEQVDDMASRYKEKADEIDVDMLIGLLPFCSREVADDIVAEAIIKNKEPDKLFTSALPFVSRGTLDKYVLEALEQGMEISELIGMALPFIQRGTADQIVKKAIEKGLDSKKLILQVLPFVSREVAEALLESALSEEGSLDEIGHMVLPFVSRDKADRVVREMIQRGQVQSHTFHAIMPFVSRELADEIIKHHINYHR